MPAPTPHRRFDSFAPKFSRRHLLRAGGLVFWGSIWLSCSRPSRLPPPTRQVPAGYRRKSSRAS